MNVFRPVADGIELHVRATPKGGRDAIDGIALLADGRSVLKVRVRAAPEDGAATAAVARVIADALEVPLSRVVLIAGATARLKTFRVGGAADSLVAALLQVVPEAGGAPPPEFSAAKGVGATAPASGKHRKAHRRS